MKKRVCGALFIISVILVVNAWSETFDGYTFVFSNKNAYLYDMDKKVVNTWTVGEQIQYCADLLRDSSIIVALNAENDFKYNEAPGNNGRYQIINWKGEIVWDYTFVGPEYWPHHDIEPVYRTNDRKEKPTFLIPCYTKCGDRIVELKPTGKTTAEVIWEWSGSDHICQSGCTDKADKLYLYAGGAGGGDMQADLMHTNNISYNRRLDQIVISCKGYNELFVIDHSTTTSEARTSSGGKSGKGGSILYRWGHASNYVQDSLHNALQLQHHCCWVQDTMAGTSLAIPGGGNFMAMNSVQKCAVEIFNPYRSGNYARNTGKAFEPAAVLWSYKDSIIQGNEGSIQKLPNNNYLICTGGTYFAGLPWKTECKVMEIVPDAVSGGRVIWELNNFGVSCEAYRYAYSYLNGSATPVKNSTNIHTDNRSATLTSSIHGGHVLAYLISKEDNYSVSVFKATGRIVVKDAPKISYNTWDLGTLPGGIYVMKMSSGKERISRTLQVQN